VLPLTDFIAGGFSIINKLIELHRLDKWARLVFSMLLSFWLSFCGLAGIALRADEGFAHALGYGLIAGSLACRWTYIRSELTKGMSETVPSALLAEDIPMQTESKK
jgi:hypothetical protein